MAAGTTRIQRLLAVSDLSPLGDAGVRQAYRVAAEGARILLLHVMQTPRAPSPLYAHYSPQPTLSEDERTKLVGEIEAHLRALIPADAASLGITTEIAIVESEDVVHSILDAARRTNAQLVCMGTHGRSTLHATLVGSVALRVLQQIERPLLLIPDREH